MIFIWINDFHKVIGPDNFLPALPTGRTVFDNFVPVGLTGTVLGQNNSKSSVFVSQLIHAFNWFK